MNARVWLIGCVVTFLACIAGIAYFHVTGQAKWAEKDKQRTLGCLVSCLVGFPFLFGAFGASNRVSLHILRRLELHPYIQLFISLAVFLAVWGLYHALDRFLASRWEFWRWLRASDAQDNERG